MTNEKARLGYVQLQRTLGDVTKIVLGYLADWVHCNVMS